MGIDCKSALVRLLNHHCRSLKELKQVQSQITTSPLSDSDRFFLTTRLVFFCAVTDFGSIDYASRVFRRILRPNAFVYNAMIRGYSSCNSNASSSSQSLALYKQMLSTAISPDNLTFPFLIKECTTRGDLTTAGAVYGHVVKLGFHGDVYIGNSMISLYCECGVMGSARKVFDEMSVRDVVSWNALIVGGFRNGYAEFALGLFRRMEGRSIYTWNSVITGCVQAGRAREALEIFQEMMNEAEPDKITIASVLTACSSIGAIDHGKWVHGYLKRAGLDLDVVIGTALIDMYGKSGCVERAVEVFEEMKGKDVLAWTAMISVFSYHGYAREALELLKDMEIHGLKPNHVTFVALLSACAHSGLVDEGRRCFHLMKNVYMIEPRVYHYACLVDVLSRAALFEEAERVIQSMPMHPDAFVWGALLGGCQVHRNTELGEKVALKLIDLDPFNYAFHVNLCDVYAKAGRFNDVKKVRALMQQKCIKKEVPGCSMVEVDGIVYEFSVRGAPEVVMEEMVLVLEGLVGQMKLNMKAVDVDDRLISCSLCG